MVLQKGGLKNEKKTIGIEKRMPKELIAIYGNNY
jgi:hypothetical protein